MAFAKAYITVIGIVLVVSGLLGFFDNPYVGADPDAILAADALHNLVHLASGFLGVWIGLSKQGEALARGVIWFGVLYLVLFIVLYLSPTLFGALSIEVNNADHVLHAVLAVLSLLIGFAARRQSSATPAVA